MKGSRWLGSLSALALAIAALHGCGDDEAPPDEPADASVPPASELEALLSRAITAYDRQVTNGCPCAVELGAYPSIDACLMWRQSRPDWVSCGTRALEPHDSSELRRALRCVRSTAEVNADCLTDTPCGDEQLLNCSRTPLQCFTDNGAAVVELDLACPDFSLLPRQAAVDAGG